MSFGHASALFKYISRGWRKSREEVRAKNSSPLRCRSWKDTASSWFQVMFISGQVDLIVCVRVLLLCSVLPEFMISYFISFLVGAMEIYYLQHAWGNLSVWIRICWKHCSGTLWDTAKGFVKELVVGPGLTYITQDEFRGGSSAAML